MLVTSSALGRDVYVGYFKRAVLACVDSDFDVLQEAQVLASAGFGSDIISDALFNKDEEASSSFALSIYIAFKAVLPFGGVTIYGGSLDSKGELAFLDAIDINIVFIKEAGEFDVFSSEAIKVPLGY